MFHTQLQLIMLIVMQLKLVCCYKPMKIAQGIYSNNIGPSCLLKGSFHLSCITLEQKLKNVEKGMQTHGQGEFGIPIKQLNSTGL